MEPAERDLEISLLLEAVFRRYRYDFRSYALSSMRRRIDRAVEALDCRTVSQLQDRVLHEPTAFPQLLRYLTIPVTDLFRDPSFYRALREQVVPHLRTYPSVKIWVAGCSTGEEAYSLAILLREEDLLARTRIYATDINPEAIRAAEAGVYDAGRIPQFTANYLQAGGRGSLSDHYTAAYGSAAFERALRKSIVFSDHDLATDHVFAEVEMVSCRNVLIYFNRELQERALGLFAESLSHRGFLGIGPKETLRFSRHATGFEELSRQDRIYRKRA